jgi:hypothetical protein
MNKVKMTWTEIEYLHASRSKKAPARVVSKGVILEYVGMAHGGWIKAADQKRKGNDVVVVD